MPVTINQKFGDFVIHAVSNTTLTIAGNTSVSNVAIGNETILGAHLVSVAWGSANSGNSWTIKRGANTFIAVSQNGFINFRDVNLPTNVDTAGSLVLEYSGAANTGFILLRMRKEGNFNQTY